MLAALALILCGFIVLVIAFAHQESSRGYGVPVSRSIPRPPRPDYFECGNCHGTGDDGFNLMPDGAPCDACDGRGCVKIDPNAKYLSFSEWIKLEGVPEDETATQGFEPQDECAGAEIKKQSESQAGETS